MAAFAVAAFTVVAYPECLALAGTAATVTHVATGILAGVAGIGSLGALVGGASMVADLQGQHGGAAFGRAFANGAKSGGVNLLQNAANVPLAFVNRAPIRCSRSRRWMWTHGPRYVRGRLGALSHRVREVVPQDRPVLTCLTARNGRPGGHGTERE